mgnify:CR=1 FL=1
MEDHCRALDLISSKGKVGENYNIGSGNDLSNLKLANIIINVMKRKFIKPGKNVKIIFVKDRPGHDLRYALNSKKIHSKLKWKPNISIYRGISKTIKWYINNPKYFKSLKRNDHIKRLGLKI